MRAETRQGLSLDAGALIALERGDESLRELLDTARRLSIDIHVVPEVIAQVWRDGSRQARIARLLSLPEVVVPDYDRLTARAVGVLCGRSGHSDVVDVHVVLHARQSGHAVVTSDPDDLRRVDQGLAIIEI